MNENATSIHPHFSICFSEEKTRSEFYFTSFRFFHTTEQRTYMVLRLQFHEAGILFAYKGEREFLYVYLFCGLEDSC